MTTATEHHPTLYKPEGMDSGDFCKLWDYCPNCGAPKMNDDTTTTCDAKNVRTWARYQRNLAKRAAIRARMEERERKFNEAQARDRLALYNLERGQ